MRVFVSLGQPSIGDAFRLDWNFASVGSSAFIGQCSMFYALRKVATGAIFPADGYNLLCQQAVAAFPQIQNYVSNSVKLRDVQLTGISDAGAAGSAQSDQAGKSLFSPVPPQAAVISSYSCAKRGRRYRNRNYWPGLSVSQQDGGALDNDAAAHYVSFLAHLLPSLIVAVRNVPSFTFKHVVYTRKLGDLPAEFNDVTGYAVRGYLGTMRRRVRGE